MAAADKTSKNQFGWVEETSHVSGPASEGKGARSRGTSVIKFVDKGSIHDPNVDEHGEPRWPDAPQLWGQSQAAVSADWRHTSPRPWTEDEEHWGENEKALGDGAYQYTMFHPGEQQGPTIRGLSSTKAGRFASARGVGIMAGILERETGHRAVEAAPNLSPQSAPFVEKLTGQKTQVTNSVGFDPRPHFQQVPNPDHPPEVYVDHQSDDTVRTTTVRWLSDEEVNAGGQRLREHMKLRREPRTNIPMDALNLPELPARQDAIPEPGGDTAEAHALRTQMEGVGQVPIPSPETRRIARMEREHRPMSPEDVIASTVLRNMSKPGPHRDKPIGR